MNRPCKWNSTNLLLFFKIFNKLTNLTCNLWSKQYKRKEKKRKTKTIGFVGKKTYKVRVIGSNTPKKAFGTILAFDWFVGTYIAQWWECAPPTPMAWVRFPDLVSQVGWVCCWFSSLLQGFFSEPSGFPPSRKTNTLNSNSTWTPWKRRATSC